MRARLEPQPGADGQDALPKIISVSLRPDDLLAKRLLSTPVATNNLLLRVTLPKRTGRKRGRGASGPFLADADAEEANGKTSPEEFMAAAHAACYAMALNGTIGRTEGVSVDRTSVSWMPE